MITVLLTRKQGLPNMNSELQDQITRSLFKVETPHQNQTTLPLLKVDSPNQDQPPRSLFRVQTQGSDNKIFVHGRFTTSRPANKTIVQDNTPLPLQKRSLFKVEAPHQNIKSRIYNKICVQGEHSKITPYQTG